MDRVGAVGLDLLERGARHRGEHHVVVLEVHVRPVDAVGDLRGTGFFYALELVKDKETRETFSDEECETLLRDFLSPRLFERGLICRADDRDNPVIQLSPPLVAGQDEFDRIASVLGEVLAEAWAELEKGRGKALAQA